MPDVGGVTVGSNLANSTSAEVGTNDLIVPNIGDLFETQVNTAVTDPSATVGAATAGVGSAIAAGVGVVLSTLGSFSVDFVKGLLSSVGSFKNTHLLALVVGLVVVVVMFH